MTTSTDTDTELLTEHFGYAPVSLIDDIINSVNILAERALNSVEQGLLKAGPSALGFKASKSQQQPPQDATAAAAQQLPPEERARNEIESGTHQLETLLCASIDRNFDKFEIYVLRNIFTVRPPELRDWMRLSHYEGLDFSSFSSSSSSITTTTSRDKDKDKDTDTPTIESITALRRRLRESMRLNAILTAERARNEALLEDLRRLVGHKSSHVVKAETASSPTQAQTQTQSDETKKSPFAFLHQKGDLASTVGGDAPIATTADFTLSQMQALRALSADLRKLTPPLKTYAAAGEDGNEEGTTGSTARGPKNWRRERVEYVETATRRHLEMVHGLELGEHGEVRDGEWQGPGRHLERGEVEGLERIIALLNAGISGDGSGPAPPPPPPAVTAVATAGASSSAPAVEEDEDMMDES
ncbi:Mis12 protein-domain-containing protein [Poronia punctata]|nr:Mis12 protein-domain-containing protein [Poronia punctata]